MDEGKGDGALSSSSAWQPRGGWAFRAYAAMEPGTLPTVVRRPLLVRLTKDIVETYQICNPNFKYSETLNPKRFLTNPSVGVLNDGHDNANSDLILHVNLVLRGSKQRYIVKDVLGQGTFGQVAKCWASETNSYVAVKIIKNQPAYYQQALVEVSLLTMLNQNYDPDDKNHIVRILDYFVYQHHLCISFEMLGSNLYELIRMNHFKGLSLSIVQVFSKQILQALVVMKDAGVIHCDLKPENILISSSVKPPEIKVIDFGSACLEGRTVYSYIQSRYYRSPEVLLGYPYTTAIDMWSFGCIVAELFLGLPLFPGASEFDLLKRMIEILGGQPSDELLRDAKNTSKFFKHVGSIYHLEDDVACEGGQSAYRVLTEEEYETREAKKPAIGKRYFNYVKLEDIVANYPYRKNLHDDEISKENLTRLALVDFLRGLVEFDPGKRWSPFQASCHPFVTGEPFTCPYKPPPETPRIPVLHPVTVDHHPGGGHWLAAGLSPQVSNLNSCLPHNSSHFQMVPMSHGTSYGSIGSHGSYNDSVGLGSSYGSYGDVGNIYTFYSPVGPSGLHMQAHVRGSLLGSSPDARRRPQMSHGNGFGVSPSAGSFQPMSLGASPSQFTPPSSQMHISTVSPGKYGPTSPARGSFHGSPLGKAAAFGQYNRRRNWVYAGSSHVQPHDSASQQWQGIYSDGISCSQPDAFAGGHAGSPRNAVTTSNYSNWSSQRGGGNGLTSGVPTNHQNIPASSAVNLNLVTSQLSEVSSDKPECRSSPPDPADWDPNYSDEQLLQEDNSEVCSLVSGVTNGMRLCDTTNPATSTSGADRFSHGHHQVYMSSNFVSSNQRTEGKSHTYALVDGSPPHGHDVKPGYSRPPHFPHNSPSRFGQQPVQQFNHVQSTAIYREPNHPKGQPPRSSYSTTDPHPPANNLLGNGITWGNAQASSSAPDSSHPVMWKPTVLGRRYGHPIATARPSSHARKDYGRIW